MSTGVDVHAVDVRQPDSVSCNVALTICDPAGIAETLNFSQDAQLWVPSLPAFIVPLAASGQSEPEQAPLSLIASAAVTDEPEMVADAVAAGAGGAAAVLTVKL